MTERLAKLFAVASMALLASLVSFGNLTDYGSNLQFVEHVLRMDTTFPGNANMYRAITSPMLQHLGYDLIILLETVTALLCWAGVIASCKGSASVMPTPRKNARRSMAAFVEMFMGLNAGAKEPKALECGVSAPLWTFKRSSETHGRRTVSPRSRDL